MDDLPSRADVVFVGAGHNALVAAAYLLQAGRSVVLLEQMGRPGGWVRTAELGAPGFHHDRWSAVHPVFVAGPVSAELGPELARHGLEYVVGPLATGSSMPGGRTAVLPVDSQEFAAELERLGERARWNRLFAAVSPYLPVLLELLGSGLDGPEPHAAMDRVLADSRDSLVPFGQLLAGGAIDLVRRHFVTEELRMLAAPWSLHSGVGPEDPASALWAVLSLALLAGGCPAPIGGSGRLADALTGVVTDRGGDVVCGVDVDEVLVRDGRAAAVRSVGGATVTADEAVIASVTPDQLYGRLLRRTAGVPAGVRSQASRYRFKRGCFQLNLALTARPRFADPRLDAGGAHNLGRGVGELATSVRQAEAGLLPQHPSISWHEPTAVDPSRAPEGKAILRLQVLDAPHTPQGDAAGELQGISGWAASTAKAFADRVLAEAEAHAPGLTGLIIERHCTTPADLARSSPNAGPGDSGAGENSLMQGFLQRPIPAHGRRLSHCGARPVADRRRDLAWARRQRWIRARRRPRSDRRQSRCPVQDGGAGGGTEPMTGAVEQSRSSRLRAIAARLGAFVVIAAALTAAGCSAAPDAEQHHPPNAAAYWDRSRLLNALPFFRERQGALAPKRLGNSHLAGPLAGLRVGALFVHSSGGNHFCTASVVASPGRDLLITAAHCINGGKGSTGYRSDIVFIPDYRDGLEPFGVWTPAKLLVAPQWAHSSDPDYDVGFVVLKAHHDQNVQEVLGANRLGTDLAYQYRVHVTGYPASSSAPITCINQTSRFSNTQ
jgi:phytoene dehydrogenase-like protein